jgi:hypothetical protein
MPRRFPMRLAAVPGSPSAGAFVAAARPSQWAAVSMAPAPSAWAADFEAGAPSAWVVDSGVAVVVAADSTAADIASCPVHFEATGPSSRLGPTA